MAGIIELWRDNKGNAQLPTRFVIGAQPMMQDGTVSDAPIVSKIDFRETGSMAGKRYDRPVFCISFEESFIQRFIMADSVVEIAYETKKADAPTTPALED